MHTFIEMFEEQERLKLLRHNEAEKLSYERLLDRVVKLPNLPSPQEAPQRGVEEVIIRAKDWRAFEVTDSSGECAMYVEWPRDKVTTGRIEGLWRWLDREDPQPQLRVVT